MSKEEYQQERRTELEKFYKKVFTCRLCNKQYGSDIEDKEIICPICHFKIHNKKSVFEK